MKVGANKCDVEITSSGKCQEGVQAITSKNGYSQSRFHQGSWGHLPPGCSIGGYGSSDKKFWPYWNNNPKGNNNGNLRKICQELKPSTSTSTSVKYFYIYIYIYLVDISCWKRKSMKIIVTTMYH